MVLFPKLVALVTEDDDDGVVAIWTLIESIEYAARAIVGVARHREIGRHHLLAPRDHGLLLLDLFGFDLDDCGQPRALVGGEGRDRNAIRREKIEILLWHIPGRVRLHNPAREEERLRLWLRQKRG